jgi:hypothetical protein
MDGLGIGRIVHITAMEHDYETGQRVTTKVCHAAIVTQVMDKAKGLIDVTIYPPGGSVDSRWSSPGVVEGDWHWPERA